YNWAAVAVSLVFGGVTDFSIRLPSILCGMGVVILTFLIGKRMFSTKVGLWAGLILTASFHFIRVSCLARTDMMLCFFITLALYLFLLAYDDEQHRSRYSLLAFVSMGLGSITKGPVGFIVPVLVVLVFLALRRELGMLKSMRPVWGLVIWTAIMGGWFGAALIEGGKTFFNVVVMDEMVNRFLGVGTRAEKTRPVYYLLGHFFGRFLPWSLFVPSALVRFWKSDARRVDNRLLFPVVWFLTVLIFFSISKGKRSDYIIPLYPAASIIVAQMWVLITERKLGQPWTSHVRIISTVYLAVCAIGTVGLALLVAVPPVHDTVMRMVPKSADDIDLLVRSVASRAAISATIFIPLVLISAAGVAAGVKKRFTPLFGVTVAATALGLAMYFNVMSTEAKTLDGHRKKTFCAEAARLIGTSDNLVFCGTKESLMFYMSKNGPYITQDEVINFFRANADPFVIISGRALDVMPPHPDFEFVQMAKCQCVEKNRTYLLLGKKQRAGTEGKKTG
ncbi:MAG: glycosyltransferase family 39 protein, partial [Candidatus Hydrogenedentes bacterium]|nr:glycosyltransferase family 39 protein [Candidatus Hydrogenedentota bacterium]